MVVANPAYSALASPPVARQLYANTSAGAYHGTVVWGFQQALMVEGASGVAECRREVFFFFFLLLSK